SRLGRSKAARDFLGLSRGAGSTARTDSRRAFGRTVIFSGFELRAVFSRAAIHESVLGVCGGRAVHLAFRGPIRAGNRSQYRNFHAASSDLVSNRVSESTRQSPQDFVDVALRR